jgi:hypothetical protein
MSFSVSSVDAKAVQAILLIYFIFNYFLQIPEKMCSPFHLGLPLFPCLYIFVISLHGSIMYID